MVFPGLDKIPMPPRSKTTYFSNHKKGEVGELRLLLRRMLLDSKSPSTTEKIVSQIIEPNVDHFKVQNEQKRRNVLKKLIGCMTLGIDLSSLYTDVVMVSQTDDPVQKKMIYLYLSNYSMDNPDLAVLAINTLLKDADSPDPVIRSLALRNLSSFGTNLSNEYATMSVLKKMFDPSDSVKRTAIIGSIRIFKSNCSTYGKDLKSTCDLLEDLKTALRSKNVHVMVDAMCAVSEIAEYDKKIPLTTPSVIYLTNWYANMKQLIFSLKDMNEWEQCYILELLWTYTPSDKDEMFDLMNLLDDKLKHNSSAIFLATAKCFLVWTKNDLFLQLEVVKRLQDPFLSLINRTRSEISYVLLANILSLIVNGIIALKIPSQLSFLMEKISDIYKFNLPHLNSSVLHVIRALFSVYPERAPELLEIVKEPSEYITDPEAKSHHISILGDYGYDLEHTPYTLEDYIDDPDRTEDMTLELLPASVKVFLKRPAEMHKALSRLFESVLESSDYNLAMSGSFYYNLLYSGVEEAEKILFEDENDRVEYDKDFLLAQDYYFVPDPEWREHFNTVYVLSNCSDFYNSNNPIFFPFEHKDVKTDIFREESLRKVVENYSSGSIEPGSEYERVGQNPESANTETLLFEELENEVRYFNLVVPETISEEDFQTAWLECEHSYSTEMELYPNDLNVEDFEGLFAKLNIMTLASSDKDSYSKMYMYTQDEQGAKYYIEVIIKGGQIKVTIKVKETNSSESALQSLSEILCDFISRWLTR
ncbi:adapter-related protein, putative [Theileria annulata]|uniref:Adapter-related protein, putative n=1 Tax=Theileria annulata TaxID=5874 RepID=Q4UI19_THEAN|nr:adapter-related protein, putative [Theileria annulata]CAI73270.1 adapter-related protein, putative [Theileria annulata]|eukprot:XP_953947.1 adapter-related protein, putative [Theileria annulata]